MVLYGKKGEKYKKTEKSNMAGDPTKVKFILRVLKTNSFSGPDKIVIYYK